MTVEIIISKLKAWTKVTIEPQNRGWNKMSNDKLRKHKKYLAKQKYNEKLKAGK